MTRATYSVPEIMCEGCATSIQKALSDLEGVGGVDVDVAGKRVRVEFDETRTDRGTVRERIEAAGFDAEDVTPG
jgi:copper chaperone